MKRTPFPDVKRTTLPDVKSTTFPDVKSTAFADVESAAEPVTHWETVAATTRWGSYVTEHERSHLLHALASLKPATALEVGCEGGRWSRLVAKHGWDVVCTDIDEASLAHCQRRLPTAKCVLVSPEDTRLPIPTAGVRLLLAYEVPAVIETPWILDEAARVLEPDGLFVCSTMNPRSLRGLAYRVLRRINHRETEGIRRFQDFYGGPSYSSFRRALRAHGFDVIHEHGFCWPPFARDSNSRLVGRATRLETALGLTRLPSLSPWVLTTAVRRS